MFVFALHNNLFFCIGVGDGLFVGWLDDSTSACM